VRYPPAAGSLLSSANRAHGMECSGRRGLVEGAGSAGRWLYSRDVGKSARRFVDDLSPPRGAIGEVVETAREVRVEEAPVVLVPQVREGQSQHAHERMTGWPTGRHNSQLNDALVVSCREAKLSDRHAGPAMQHSGGSTREMGHGEGFGPR
jgi:hypothetical protein